MSEPTEPKKVTFGLLWLLLIIVVVLWAGYWAGVHFLFKGTWTEKSDFGEMFGGINALFSAFAFAGLIFTILLQREDLELQREELRQTRDELKGQKEQLAAQSATFKQQTFDSIFFQLLSIHLQLTENIRLRDSGREVEGRECFGVILSALRNEYHDVFVREKKADEMRSAVIAYERVYRGNQARCGHYFRTLYNIFKFVKKSDVEDKKFYTNLVRAQLSSNELALLFYNCASPWGSVKFKPLIEEYGVLKQLDKGLLLDAKHEGLYQPSAFQ